MGIFSHKYSTHSDAFLEHVNITFYMWPIACSLFAQNITAELRGDNVLLWKETMPAPTGNPTPFIRSSAPNDTLEIAWGTLMHNAFLKSVGYISTSAQLFTPFELKLSSGLNNTNNSLALLGERLTTVSSLSYALFVQGWRTSPPATGWKPVFAAVSGSRSFVMGCLDIQIVPLAIGVVTCSIMIFVFVTASRWSRLSDDIIRDGRVINMHQGMQNVLWRFGSMDLAPQSPQHAK